MVAGYTRNDLEHWSDLAARVLHGCGVTPDDVVQVSFGYGMLNRGLGFHYGAERIGASVLPGSMAEIRKQLLIMRDFRTTVIVCSPSYAQYLLAQREEMGMDPKELFLRVGLFGGEPWEETMRADFEQGFLLDAFDQYALPEVMGPGIAGECTEKNGMHIAEDHFLPEVVDPETGVPLDPGEEGELVLTSLTREAFPLIRFRTGDRTRLFLEPCACGRTHARMASLKQAERDLVRVNGVPVSLARVRDILEELYGKDPCYQVIVDREQGEDRVQLWLEMRQRPFDDEMKKIESLRWKITERLRDALRIKVHLTLMDHRSLVEATEKQGRLVDKRVRPK
jgi:phenylacetate-CoA ligase